MHFTKFAHALIATSSVLATNSPTPSGSALALIESQDDLTLIAGLIKRDPELVKFYSSIQNVTIFAAPDSTFSDTDPNSILYFNREYLAAILKAVVVEGIYPAASITIKPKYVNTKLQNPRFVDTSRGRAVAKLVEQDGKKTANVGAGTTASVVKADLRFTNGILHKISNPLTSPRDIFNTAGLLDLRAYTRVDPITISVVEILETAPDSTVFSITNEAAAANLPPPPSNATAAELLNAAAEIIAYFVISPGVYFEEAFDGRTVKALNGFELKLAGFGTGKLTVNDAIVVKSDIFLTNGVVHILDRPVIPLKA